MNANEFRNLKLYDLLEKGGNLYVYLGEDNYTFTVLSENEHLECSKIELLKEFTVSQVSLRPPGFYMYKGNVSQIWYDYKNASICITQASANSFFLPISKQVLSSLQTNCMLDEVNSILNIAPGGNRYE